MYRCRHSFYGFMGLNINAVFRRTVCRLQYLYQSAVHTYWHIRTVCAMYDSYRFDVMTVFDFVALFSDLNNVRARARALIKP